MLVGEAPGADEDRLGIPFVGASGRLLDKMLASADIARDRVFITNVCRCRPPANRKPEPDEVAACKRWLWKELKLVDPVVLIPMGATAAKLLLRGDSGFRITREVGKARRAEYLRQDGIVVPMFHPSYLLQHNMDKVKDMVKILIKARRYADNEVSHS